MRALDYKSVSTVATHINGLIARGWLLKKDNSARTLEVVMPGSQPKQAPQTVGTVSAEQEIMKKLDELRGEDNEANAKQIQTLLDALEILGYTEARAKYLV